MLVSPPGQPMATTVQASAGNAGSVNDARGSRLRDARGIGGWLLRAKARAHQLLSGAAASNSSECTPGELLKFKVQVKGCNKSIIVVALHWPCTSSKWRTCEDP